MVTSFLLGYYRLFLEKEFRLSSLSARPMVICNLFSFIYFIVIHGV